MHDVFHPHSIHPVPKPRTTNIITLANSNHSTNSNRAHPSLSIPKLLASVHALLFKTCAGVEANNGKQTRDLWGAWRVCKLLFIFCGEARETLPVALLATSPSFPCSPISMKIAITSGRPIDFRLRAPVSRTLRQSNASPCYVSLCLPCK